MRNLTFQDYEMLLQSSDFRRRVINQYLLRSKQNQLTAQQQWVAKNCKNVDKLTAIKLIRKQYSGMGRMDAKNLIESTLC